MPKPFDQTRGFSDLQKKTATIPGLTDKILGSRLASWVVSNPPVEFFYGASQVDDAILADLQALCDEQSVIPRYQRLIEGQKMNPTEGRPVQHHKTRHAKDRGFYGDQQAAFTAFSNQVREGEILASDGTPFKAIVQIGIGGSELGPRAIATAFSYRYPAAFDFDFISNVDPDSVRHVLSKYPVKQTLFIAVSKSGSTQETLTNLDQVRMALKQAGVSDTNRRDHLIAVTGQGSPMDNPDQFRASFYIDDAIGGRYSVTSAVGGVLLSLLFGPDRFEDFLRGAGKMDQAAKNPDLRQNAALMAASIGVWERLCGYSALAIIPYSEALSRFPAHIQQVDCESNGKHVSLDGDPISYSAGPVIFGEPGTNSQHSFFQNIHQGRDIIPVQFMGFKTAWSQTENTVLDAQKKLIANLVAQMGALALGKTDTDARKSFPGNRPSTLIWAQDLTAETCGALLSFYENKIMFQGFIWHINSFDQEGVQLGKKLASGLLDGTSDSVFLLDLYRHLIQG